MSKIIFFLILFTNSQLFSQANLPTSFDFSTLQLPLGWTEIGTSTYSSSGNTVPALKFDNTNDKLTIQFSSSPGNLTYYLKGNSFSLGIFQVEESVNGSVWTTLHSFIDVPSDSYTLFTDSPNSNSRFIRFNYKNKVNGNIGLDDVRIDIAGPTPQQEINVQFQSQNVVSKQIISQNSPLSVTLPLKFDIQNLGTLSDLTISSIEVSGVNASDFSVQSIVSTIPSVQKSEFILNFTPSATGSRICKLSILSNDYDEGVYEINIYGIGGDLATEPVSQPTNLLFSTIKSFRILGSFSKSNDAEGYLILRKDKKDVFEVPKDGTVYKRGDRIGDAQVVSSSDYTNFSPSHIEANSNYHFAVFAYNGYGLFRKYLTNSPLIGAVTSPVTMMKPSYYDKILTESNNFSSELHNLISSHKSYPYSDYTQNMIAKFEMRDTIDNQKVLTCVYSGENKIYSEPFDWSKTGFSREHSYCHNWMPTNPANNPEKPEYEDYHHLFPTNQINANEVRSNYPLGKVIFSLSSYLDSKFGFNSKGELVFEPRDSHKGDVARAILYMAICYNGIDGNNWGLKKIISPTIQYGQDQEILKEWNFQDPPSNWEIARNDYIDSLQGNRNPFIDRPEFACFIDFNSMTYLKNGCSLSLNEVDSENVKVFPNPFNDEIIIELNDIENSEVQVLDLNARLIYNTSFESEKFLKLNLANIQSGIYYLKVISQESIFIQKIVKK